MAFRVATETGQIISIDGNSAMIGRDDGCAIPFPDDDRLQPHHAMIKRVAGRWIVESQGDHLIAAGNGAPARVNWIQPGDKIRLSEQGPVIEFEPTAESAPQAPSAIAASVVAAPVDPPAAAPAPPVTTAPSPAPSTPSANPFTWLVAGMAAVLLIGFVTVGLLWAVGAIGSRDNAAVAVAPPDPNTDDPSQPAGGGAHTTPTTPAPPVEDTTQSDNIDDALYLVVIKLQEGQMSQLGAAFAITPHRLATTAAVVESLQRLSNSPDGMTAILLSPVTKHEIPLQLDKTVAHPRFVQTTTQLNEVIPQLEALDKQLAQTADEEARRQTIDQLVELQERAYQISEERFFYDVGVIEVDEELPAQVKLADADQTPRAGAGIALSGIPVEKAEKFIDPDAPPQPEETAGQIVSLLKPAGALSPHRLVLTCDRDLTGFDWPGSALLNSQGKVIGIYARTTPPPPGQPQRQGKTTHDAINIQLLRDLRVDAP